MEDGNVLMCQLEGTPEFGRDHLLGLFDFSLAYLELFEPDVVKAFFIIFDSFITSHFDIVEHALDNSIQLTCVDVGALNNFIPFFLSGKSVNPHFGR